MPRLRPVARPDPDRLRRGASECVDHARRRDGRRPRGSRGTPVRRARPAASSTARSRRRASTAATVYVTNVVKHFKFEERGKRRIHQTPTKGEIDACMPWLRHGDQADPSARAASRSAPPRPRHCSGSSFRLTQHRGELLESELAPVVTATIHPSAIVRDRDQESREAERRGARRATCAPSRLRWAVEREAAARLIGDEHATELHRRVPRPGRDRCGAAPRGVLGFSPAALAADPRGDRAGRRRADRARPRPGLAAGALRGAQPGWLALAVVLQLAPARPTCWCSGAFSAGA